MEEHLKRPDIDVEIFAPTPRLLLRAGGAMIQGGTHVGNASGNQVAVPFPKPFATSDVTIIVVQGDTTATGDLIVLRSSTTATGFVVRTPNATGLIRIEWIAFGSA